MATLTANNNSSSQHEQTAHPAGCCSQHPHSLTRRSVHFTLVSRLRNLPKASRLMNAVSLQSPVKHLALLLPTSSRFYLLPLGG